MTFPADFLNQELSVALSASFGIEELRAGKHVIRNSSGERTKNWVRKLWAAEIRPPASPSALMVVTEHSDTSKVAVGLRQSGRITIVEPMDVQSDSVSHQLCKVDLWSGTGQIPFGGFSYRLLVSTMQSSAQLSLGRATHASRLALASTLFDLLCATVDETPDWTAFVEEWKAELAFLKSVAK